MPFAFASDREKGFLGPPLSISAIRESRWSYELLRTAVELDVCSAVAAGCTSVGAVAGKLQLNENAAGLLLNSLIALGFISRQANELKLSDEAATYLDKASPLYIGNYILGVEKEREAWQQLPQAIRTGKPISSVNKDMEAEEFFPQLAANIFPLNFTTAQMVVKELALTKKLVDARVLDIACGSAVWSIPFALHDTSVKVDALDFPAVIAMTKKFVGQYGVEPQYSYLTGNWREVPLAPSTYDFVLLGHILHSEGEALSKQLLQYAFQALKPGGKLIMAEVIIDNDRQGPPFATLFALNMMLLTENGCVFSMAQLEKLMAEIGFTNIERMMLPVWQEHSPLVIATKC